MPRPPHGAPLPGRLPSPFRRAAMPGPAGEEMGRMDREGGEANRVRIPGGGADAVYGITAFGQRVEGVDLENTWKVCVQVP